MSRMRPRDGDPDWTVGPERLLLHEPGVSWELVAQLEDPSVLALVIADEARLKAEALLGASVQSTKACCPDLRPLRCTPWESLYTVQLRPPSIPDGQRSSTEKGVRDIRTSWPRHSLWRHIVPEDRLVPASMLPSPSRLGRPRTSCRPWRRRRYTG